MKEKYRINKGSISIMGGICCILFALVTLFSKNTPFVFLSNTISGAFGFIGFWLLLPFVVALGLYLIFNKRAFKLKLGVEIWGIVILIFCFLILSSHWGSWGAKVEGIEITGKGRNENGTAEFLTFSNAISVFKYNEKNFVSAIGPSTKLGGGRVGFVLAGAINSAISPVGLNIVCWIFFVGSITMIFNKQFAKLFKYLKIRKLLHKDDDKDDDFKEVNLVGNDLDTDQEIAPISNPVQQEAPVYDNKPIFESFHTSAPINNDYDLKKAHFSLPEDDKVDNHIEEFARATFESPKPIQEEIPETKVESEPEESLTIETSEKKYAEPFFEPLQDKEQEEEQFEEPEPEPIPQETKPVDFVNTPQPKANLVKNYIYPSIDLLDIPEAKGDDSDNEQSCLDRTEIINRAFKNLHIGAEVVSHTVGPSVTRYDVQTNEDVSVTALQRFIPDISVRLGGIPVRFEQIVAGKSTSGLEIPNEVRTNVSIRECVAGLPKDQSPMNIPFGKSISGELKYANLADFPHMLIAGTTGSGKSIFVHSTIISLIMRNKPEELKLVMVDPKRVEMNYYDNIPHLLCPVISDVRKVFVCFTKLVNEMERRYILFQDNKVRDIKGFNKFAKANDIQPLPYIVVFIDEYADLIETCKEIREPVVKIVQKARAAGIHMVFATQRPSVNVIDGVIKANVATRVALMCASPQDSVTVIGEGGAEKLLGYGDMLIECSLISRSMKPRVQGCYVSEAEINRVCDFLRDHYQPQFDPMYLNLEPVVEEKSFEEPEVAPIDKTKTDEEAYQRIKDDARHREFFSISYITRTYGMGYSRAGKMFTRLQKEGIVALQGDARGCKVLVYTPGEQQFGTIEQSTLIPDDGTDFNNMN